MNGNKAQEQVSSKKLLVVEDDLILRRALTDELTGEGFRVFQAGDGEAGLQMAFQERPDLILLDIIMPKFDGLTVMQKIRRDEWGKTVPIIIFTVLEPDDTILKIIDKNAPAHYLVKSKWKLEDVVKKVKAVLFSQ